MTVMAKGDVGRRLREALEQVENMRPADLARKAGVSPQVVNGWLRGIHDPPYDRLPELAQYVKTSVDFLVSGGTTDVGSGLMLTPVNNMPKLVKSVGAVPNRAWREPVREWLEVHMVDIDVAECVACTVVGDHYVPRFPHGRIVVFKRSKRVHQGTWNLAVCGTRLAIVRSEGSGFIEANGSPVPESRVAIIGYAVHEDSTDPDGIPI